VSPADSRAGRARRRRRAGIWPAAVWLTLVALAALTARWLPLDPIRQDLRHSLAAPGWSHPFGTTRLGEDLLARTVYGARVSLVVGGIATVIGLVVGGLMGMAAGTMRRWLDPAVVVLVDAGAAFPPLVLAMTMVLVAGPGVATVTATVALLTVPGFARVARTATAGVMHRDFVLAARVTGSGPVRLVTREVLPNVTVPLVSYACVTAGTVMVVEGTLSFLGLGVGTDEISWGQLVAEGQSQLGAAPHVSLIPAAALVMTVLSLSRLGDALARRGADGAAPAGEHDDRSAPVGPAGPQATQPALPAGGPAPTGPARLEVEGLSVVVHTADRQLPVVRDVSFALRAGELLGLAGESGSGKSTLARSLVALAPHGVRVSITGSVRLDGVDLLQLDAAALRARRGRGIAQVLQDPATALDPVMRVGPQIAELVRLHQGLGRAEAATAAVRLMERAGIGDTAVRARCYPHELSGGLRQRVALARALACRPAVLVADEATSSVDVTTQRLLVDLLDELRRDEDLAVLLISHDLSLLAERADRIAVLYAGRIVELGPAVAVTTGARMPYTAALVASAPHLGDPPHRPLPVIAGAAPSPGALPTGCAFAPRCPRVGARCRHEVPALMPVGPAATGPDAHLVACWYPLGPDGPGPAPAPDGTA